ncbi:MAG: PAS domain-containing sensor histidine kinase, partial [Holophaga sp.]
HLNNRWYDCVAYQYKPDHFVAAFLDITDRKHIEEGLNQSEQKFRTLFENLAEGVALHELVWDDQGAVVNFRILAVNPAYQRHTGLDAASAPGRLGTEIYGTEVPPYLEEFSKVALGGEPYAFDTYFPPLDKHFRISVISPRHGQFATVFEDITERKHREEELKQKNAEMERFTYMISHDLKSPLVTVRTFLGYLEQDLTQGKQERVTTDMGFIRDATEKMGRLLEDLLEVSRVGRVVNPPVRVSLADLIQGALAAVAGALASQKVAVHVNAPHLVLVGDRPRLEEIWQNLLENAAKYMGEQPQPTIQLGAEMQGEDTIFFVKDNGMGIDPRFHAKIFGLFEKLDAGSEGTGLGLALVKRIVEFHEGQIWVESEGQGQGTCFRFTLPLALKARAAEL